MTVSAPKVFYIGLDALSRKLLLQWSSEGSLPHLKKLMDSAAWGMTRNDPGIYTGSVWPTLWSGAAPGNHGCYYNEQIVPGTYETEDFLGAEVKREPFWNELSRQGLRIGVFDVPKTPLSKGLNGFHIVDWGTHDAEIPACSWPAGLLAELEQAHGSSGFRRCVWIMDGAEPEATLQQRLLERIETRVAMSEDLLRREAVDLFMLGFGESHCVGHQCWHVHDQKHPWHDAQCRQDIGDPMKKIYSAIDQAVGRLWKLADEQTLFIVHCSHGMAAHYDASYLLDEALRRLEGQAPPRSRVLLDRVRKMWKKLPVGFTERFGSMARAVNRLPDAGDRAARPCFVVPSNANCPGIRLNLVGREPNGVLHPGAEADAFVDRLEADLMEFREAADGRQLVKEIIRRRDAFPGDHAELLPDLFVRWNRNEPITGMRSPRIGAIVREDDSTRRSGDHRPGGLLIACGPGVPVGERLPVMRDADLAPSLAAYLGVELANMDGEVLSTLVARPG